MAVLSRKIYLIGSLERPALRTSLNLYNQGVGLDRSFKKCGEPKSVGLKLFFP